MSIGMEDAVYFDKVVSEYEGAVDPGLVEFIESVRSAPKSKVNELVYTVSAIGDRQRLATERLLGKEVSARANVISGSDINHIDYRHGENGVADHSMAEIEDMARIGYILEHYDRIDFLWGADGEIKTSGAYTAGDGKAAPIIIYVKRINGFHCVVEAINDGKRGRLNIVSSYKSSGDPIEINKAQMPRATVR